MDPSIVKLLEEDEDETMHSGADVEAFTAALNRDIGGDPSLSLADDPVLPRGSQTVGNQIPECQTSRQGNESTDESQQLNNLSQQKHIPVDTDQKQCGCDGDQKQTQEINIFSLQQNNTSEIHNESIKQSQGIHQETTTQQTPIQFQSTYAQASEHKSSDSWRDLHIPITFSHSMPAEMKPTPVQDMDRGQYGKVPFALLLSALSPHLDKDRVMQINTLFEKLKMNQIAKNGFVRHIKSIVGRNMLKTALMKLHSQHGQNLFPGYSMKMPPSNDQQFNDPHSPAQLHQRGHNSAGDFSLSSSVLQTPGGSTRGSAELMGQCDIQAMPMGKAGSSSLIVPNQESDYPAAVMQGIIKQNPQNLRFPQMSFPVYGSGGTPAQPHTLHPTSFNQNPGLKQPIGAAHRMITMRNNSIDEMKRAQGGSFPIVASNTVAQQNMASHKPAKVFDHNTGVLAHTAYVKQEQLEHGNEQRHKYQMPSQHGPSSIMASQTEQRNASMKGLRGDILEQEFSPMAPQGEHNIMSRGVTTVSSAGINAKTPPKKTLIGQKKPLETLGSSPPFPSKKQKVGGTSMDQSIEQLNDVTAVSGVNIREEEEQLFSGSKEEVRVSEASRKVVQEEEERLILQRIPLHNKIAQIMAKHGLKGLSSDVERCISLCVEERLRGLIHNVIRSSKQRADTEKMRHKVHITSDVRQKILTWKKKSKEEWESRMAETEKLQKPNEQGGDDGADGDKEKGESRSKQPKINKEEDDKMRATAANVAARAAVGGDDMFSKWQLMAEKAREKLEGVGVDTSPLDKDASHNLLPSSRQNGRDGYESEKGIFSASEKLPGKQVKRMEGGDVGRNIITIRDVISVLEREPQMSKSTFMYCLYEGAPGRTAAAALRNRVT